MVVTLRVTALSNRMTDIFSPLQCAQCGESFPENIIPNSCDKCGSTSYKNATTSLALRVSIGNSYAINHIKSAALFARNSWALEEEYSKDTSGLRFYSDNEAFVTSAVFHSVAFLEATINELFASVAEGGYKEFNDVYGEATSKQIQQLWDIRSSRMAATIEKYEIILILCNKAQFDKGHRPYQNVDLLIALRNHLIHAEPESHTLFTIGDIPPTKSLRKKLMEGLRNKFPENRLTTNLGNPFFPYKCLGHGCAEWSVISSLAFADEFFQKLGLPGFHAQMGDTLATRWTEAR